MNKTKKAIEKLEKLTEYKPGILKANAEIAERYLELLNKKSFRSSVKETSKPHLINMLKTIIDDQSMTPDKSSRFLGYVQGILVVKEIISVEEERELTRPIFQKVYEASGLSQKTVEIQ